MNLLTILLSRLREASTWRGLVLILTALGVQLDPQYQEAIIAAGIGLAGLLAVVLPDRLGGPKE